MSNLDIWDKVKQPPRDALKQIGGGRLKGMTDINPQWRLKAMTELFGPCGTGWKYEIIRTWTEQGVGEEKAAFAIIDLFYKTASGEWSSAVPGIGGNSLVQRESAGPRTNDEAYKMAITDALSTAMKALGVGADVYAGKWDGSKYNTPKQEKSDKERIADGVKWFKSKIDEDNLDNAAEMKRVADDLPKEIYQKIRAHLDTKSPGGQKLYRTLLDEHLKYTRDMEMGIIPEREIEDIPTGDTN